MKSNERKWQEDIENEDMGWVIVTPRRNLLLHTIRTTKEDSIEVIAAEDSISTITPWDDLHKLGWRCCRVVLRLEKE